MTRALLIVLAIAAAGCPPFYRDGELAAARAADGVGTGKLVDEGRRALDAGEARRAVRVLREASRRAPRDGAVFALLARAEAAAGHQVAARAAAEWALTRPGGHADAREVLAVAAVEDQLYANAIDRLRATTVAELAARAELAPIYGALAEAESLAAARPAEALERYAAWLAQYGEPDHPVLRAASARVRGAARALTAESLARARAELRAGRAQVALLYFGAAYRYQPDDEFAGAADDFVRAAAAPGAETLSPTARAEAERGDAALARHRPGEALHAYRRAVAAAPWWAGARRNLAALLAGAGLYDEARRQLGWFLKLAPEGGAEIAEATRTLARWRDR